MKNDGSGFLLLRTLLLSTSQRNVYRHTKDRKKRRRIVGNTIGAVILYALLMAYSVAMSIGYGQLGLTDATPGMCALVVSLLAFFFTLFKTNGYLFGFKEFDMLMALPFEVKAVAGSKFLYMYVKSLPWYLSISLAMMAGYGYYARPGLVTYPLWVILSFFLPVLSMLAAAFLGFLIAKASAGFKKTNIVQTVLTFILALFAFSLRFILEDIFRNGKVASTLEMASEMTQRAARVYPPIGWFSDAVTKGEISSALLLTGVSLLLFALVFEVVGRSYIELNSALKSHTAAGNYQMSGQKRHGVVWSIAFKEYKRLTGSTLYMTNAALGEILAVLMGIIMLILGFDRVVALVTQGAPLEASILWPAIPFIVYFFIGMVATTVCSPSLEGKNYWIVQSLPIEKKTLYQGKMLFNMLLTAPPMAFSVLCLCISARAPVLETILYLILGFALCAFSTAWGCVCGIRHMRLDWENEVEVIKQGTAVAFYMLPNMIAVIALTVLVVFLGLLMDRRILAFLFIVVVTLLAALSYWRVMALARKAD